MQGNVTYSRFRGRRCGQGVYVSTVSRDRCGLGRAPASCGRPLWDAHVGSAVVAPALMFTTRKCDRGVVHSCAGPERDLVLADLVALAARCWCRLMLRRLAVGIAAGFGTSI